MSGSAIPRRKALGWIAGGLSAGVAGFSGFRWALPAVKDWLGITEAKAKRTRDDFYPWEALDPDKIAGLEAIAADAMSLKYLTAPLTKAQLDELVQVPAQ